MPLYDYDCPSCGEFSLHRPIARRDEATPCPLCATLSLRQISAPRLSLMPSGNRSAHARNEKSRHEPGFLDRHRCSSGCGCGPGSAGITGGKKKPRTVVAGKLGELQTSRSTTRPWMLGH